MLNTAETYDAVAGEWAPMPDMIKRKMSHKLVAVGNKLFCIGLNKNDCEVFDGNQFVSFRSPQVYFCYTRRLISIGNNIFVLQKEKKSVFCYDVGRDEWSTRHLDYNPFDVHCLRLPWF